MVGGDFGGEWVRGEGKGAGMGWGRPSQHSCLRRTSVGSQEMPSWSCHGNLRNIVSGHLFLMGALDRQLEKKVHDLL